MPELMSPLWWTLISTVVLGVGIGVLRSHQLVVRFMTVKSDRELNRGVIGGVFIMLMTGVAFIVGALSNASISSTRRARSRSPRPAAGQRDSAVHQGRTCPSGFRRVRMITLLAAAMSLR